MTNIPNQSQMWDKKHAAGDHDKLRGRPSPFAQLAEPYFPRSSHILELGCGVGRDAIYFAKKGHEVVATDSSSIVILQNKTSINESGIDFQVFDMQDTFPYLARSFDVVYANLALHYYTDAKTREIIQNIARVLKPAAILAFACKSKDEERIRGATELEANLFVAPNGHATHFFSKEYAAELVQSTFDIKWLDEVDEEYQGRVSSIVRCIAKKVGG